MRTTGSPLLRATLAILATLAACVGLAIPASASPSVPAGQVAKQEARQGAGREAEQDVVVEYYYGEGCPVCAVAGPWLEALAERTPGLRLEKFEVWSDTANQQRLMEAVDRYNMTASGVPVVFVGERAWVGFREGVTDVQIEAAVQQCADGGCADPATVELPEGRSGMDGPAQAVCEGTAENPFQCAAEEDTSDVLSVPLVGDLHLGERSLLVSTVLIALVDGVNPCSLWVLTILIALSLNTGSRRRTMIIGFTFITVTAAIYALFIAGLFTVFTFVAFAPWIRVLVALVALFFGLVSVKDYFWFKQGLSFTIADDKKPGIYRGMRRVLAQGDNLPAMVGATAVLAAGVSLVEFGCTAGFPLLWTNLLSAQQATVGTFVVLLMVYMLIYQLDELAIFTTAVVTLRASKLQEKQGRVLKLVGGVLMLALAVAMLVDPELMNGLGSSLVVFGVAMAVAVLVLVVHRVVLPRFGIVIGSEKGLGDDDETEHAERTAPSGRAR